MKGKFKNTIKVNQDKIDFIMDNPQDIAKEEYDRLFSELSEEDKKEFLGKNLYWVEGIYIRPDGTTTAEEDN